MSHYAPAMMTALLAIASAPASALAWDGGGGGGFDNIIESTCQARGDALTVQVNDAAPLTLQSASGAVIVEGAQRFTLRAPVMVETPRVALPLPTIGDLTIDCSDGGFVGEVSLDDVPVLGELMDQDFSVASAMDAFGDIGLDIDPGALRFSIGYTRGEHMVDAMGPLDPNAWYLFLDAELRNASLESEGLRLNVGSSLHFTWWLDPSDPAIYTGLRGSILGDATTGFLSGVGLGFSNTGNLHWTPVVELRGPNGSFDPQLTGHAALELKVGLQPYPEFPVTLGIDGDWMFDFGDRVDFADVAREIGDVLRDGLRGRPVNLHDIPLDVRYGANARNISLDVQMFSVSLGAATTYTENGRLYFRTVPNALIANLGGPFWQGAQGIAELSVGDDPIANARMETARQILAILPSFMPREIHGWITRDGDATDWRVVFLADLTYGGCQIEGAQVTFSNDGIEVTHDVMNCAFMDWAEDALDAMCDGIDDTVQACLEYQARENRCSFACVEGDTCYDNCRDAGIGERICNAGCAMAEGISCPVSAAAEQACEAALRTCERLDDFCAEREIAATLPGGGDTGGDPASCTPGHVDGYVIRNQGDTQCGRWARVGGALRATGNHHTSGRRPVGGSLLVKRLDHPDQLGNGTYKVFARGTDNDAAGLIVNYQDPQSYYVATMDDQTNRVELWRRHGSTDSRLAGVDRAIDLRSGHWLAVRRSGDSLAVMVDGVTLFSADTHGPQTGSYGVYSWANDQMDFTSLRMDTGCWSNEFDGWEMVNKGFKHCAHWDAVGGEMVARGNLHANSILRPVGGGALIERDTVRSSGHISATIHSEDNDVAGLVIDYRNADTFTFATLDQEHGVVQLWRRRPINGQVKLRKMTEAAIDLDFSAGHQLDLRRVGDFVEVRVDGVQVLRARCIGNVGGRLGLYTYAMHRAAFTEVNIR